MSDLTGMFSALNESINANPLAAKGPGTPEGMPYNPMDNINPLMASVAQGVGNVVGTDPALNQTSGQKMTESNAAGASAMQTGDPAGLMAAAQLMFKQGRPKEAQALVERADAIKAQTSATALSAKEEGDRVAENARAAVVAEEAGHTEWAKRLRTGDLPAQDYYAAMAENEAELLKQNAIGRNKGDTQVSAGVLKVSDEAYGSAYASKNSVVQSDVSLRRLDRIEESGTYTPGILGGLKETFKYAVGGQDEVTTMLEEYNSARVSKAIAGLPPGPASDKDIELVQSGAPSANANLKTIRAFMEAMKRLEQRHAIFYEMKGDMVINKGNTQGLFASYETRLRAEGLWDGAPPPRDTTYRARTSEEIDAAVEARQAKRLAEMGVVGSGKPRGKTP